MFEFLGIARLYKLPFLKTYWKRGELRAVLDCFIRNHMVEGPETNQFENRIRETFGAKFAFATNSGRTGIQNILEALPDSEKTRNEVLVPSFGCTGTIQPIIQAGLKPVFVDIGKDLNIDTNSTKDKITERTRAIIVPSLCGKPADWGRFKKLRREDVFLIDDAAQSMGAEYDGRTVGTLGDAGIFSFTLGKILSSTGGGMVVTDSQKLYERISEKGLAHEKYFSVMQRTFRTLALGPYRAYALPLYSIKSLVARTFPKKDFACKSSSN